MKKLNVCIMFSVLGILFATGVLALDGWSTAGVNLGSIKCLKPSIVHANGLYAGSHDGFYFSGDEGLQWKKQHTGDFSCFVISDTWPETIVASKYDKLIHISEDQGKTWESFDALGTNPSTATVGGTFRPGTSDEFFLLNSGISTMKRENGVWGYPGRAAPAAGWQNSYKFQAVQFFKDRKNDMYLLDNNLGLVVISDVTGEWVELVSAEMPPGFNRVQSLFLNDIDGTIFLGSDKGKIAYAHRDLLEWQFIEPPEIHRWSLIQAISVSPDNHLTACFDRSVYQFHNDVWQNLNAPEYLSDHICDFFFLPSNLNLLTGGATGCIMYNGYLRTWQVRNKGIDEIDLNCLLAHHDTVLIGTKGAGIYKSLDAGQTWNQSNSGLPGLSVSSISDQPGVSGRFYAICKGMLVVSTDNGHTWRQTGMLNDELLTNISVIKPIYNNDQHTLIIGKENPEPYESPVCISTDMGETFSECIFPDHGNESVTFIHRDLSDNNTILVGCGNLFIASAAQFHFIQLTDWNTSFGRSVTALTQDPIDTDKYWMIREKIGVMRSEDNKDTWQTCNSSAFETNWSSIVRTYLTSSSLYICRQSVDETESGFLRSDDDGYNWQSPFYHSNRLSFVARSVSSIDRLGRPVPADKVWVAHRDGSISAKTIGDTSGWQPLSAEYTLPGYSVNDMAYSESNPDVIYLATENRGVVKSIDAGWTWSEVNSGIPISHLQVRTIDIDTRFPDDAAHRLMIGCATSDDTHHRIYESTDSAVSWQRKDISGDFNAKIVDLEMVEIPVENDDVWLATYGDGAWRSADGGQQWLKQTFESDPPGQFLTSINHTDYAAGGGEPWITASSHGGGGSFIYDPGQNQFRIRNHGLPGYTNNDVYVDLITPDPQRYMVLWAATDRGLYLTKDLGETWVPSLEIDSSDLSPEIPGRSSVAFNNGDTCYIRQGSGVFRSQHGLTVDSWESLTKGLSNEELRKLTVVEAVGQSSRRRLLGCPAGSAPLAYPISSTVKSSGADLVISQPLFHAGDSFDLDLILSNSDESSREVGVVVLLELYGQYYWWPSWDTDFDYERFSVPPGQSFLDVLAFTWPTGSDHGNATIYSGMLSVEDGSLIGDIDWIAVGWV